MLGIGVNVAVDLGGAARRSCARAPARSASAPDAIEPTLERLLRAARATGWQRRGARGRSTPGASATRCSVSAIEWSGGRGTARGIDERGRLRVLREDGRHELLDAGEVHLVAP